MLDRNGLVHFLKNTPAISRINFAFESFRIYPTAYTHDVANAISSGKIGIKYANLEDGVAAEYLNNEDVFCFDPGFTIDTTGPYDLWENKGTVIHECTHAYIDIQGIGLNRVIVNESVAYLAESVFVLAMGYNQVKSWLPLKRDSKRKSRIMTLKRSCLIVKELPEIYYPEPIAFQVKMYRNWFREWLGIKVIKLHIT